MDYGHSLRRTKRCHFPSQLLEQKKVFSKEIYADWKNKLSSLRTRHTSSSRRQVGAVFIHTLNVFTTLAGHSAVLFEQRYANITTQEVFKLIDYYNNL